MSTGLRVVGGTEVDRGYAFRPSSLLKHANIEVRFERAPTKAWSWRRFRFVPACLVVEVWHGLDDGSEFEPGNCWVELDGA